jgi:hypothetical protein
MKFLNYSLVSFLIFGFLNILCADDFSDAENAYISQKYSNESVEIFEKSCDNKNLKACIYLGSILVPTF